MLFWYINICWGSWAPRQVFKPQAFLARVSTPFLGPSRCKCIENLDWSLYYCVTVKISSCEKDKHIIYLLQHKHLLLTCHTWSTKLLLLSWQISMEMTNTRYSLILLHQTEIEEQTESLIIVRCRMEVLSQGKLYGITRLAEWCSKVIDKDRIFTQHQTIIN